MNRARLLTTVLSGGVGASPLLTDLVAYWKLDESSNGTGAVTRNDSVGTNHLTDNNTTPSGTGLISNCAQLSGPADNERLSITDNTVLSMGDVNCAFWVWFNPTNLSANYCMIGKAGDTNNWEYVIRIAQTTGLLSFIVSDTGASGDLTTVTTGNGATAGAWNLAICWHDPTANKIYAQLNNSTVAETAHTGGIFDGNSTFYLGFQQFGAVKYLGGIDEVGIRKGSLLTAADRTSLWNGGAGVTHPF